MSYSKILRIFAHNSKTEHIILMYYVYILRRFDNQQTYIGYTNNLKRRLGEHRLKKPELVYYEAYSDKRDAEERERKLKQRGQTVRRLKERLRHSLT